MEGQLVVSVEPLVKPVSLQSRHDDDNDAPMSSFHEGSSNSQIADRHDETTAIYDDVEVGGRDALDNQHHIQTLECRICQEEDDLINLEIPCACRGTLKFAHRRCVQLWCNEKADTTCEICHQQYQPDYSAYRPEVSSNESREARTISRTPLNLHDPRILTISAVEHQVLDHGGHAYDGTNGIAFFRSVALILTTLLLLRHAASLFDTSVEKALTYFFLFLFRAAAFILPCYLIARTIRIIRFDVKDNEEMQNLHLCCRQSNNPKAYGLLHQHCLLFTDLFPENLVYFITNDEDL